MQPQRLVVALTLVNLAVVSSTLAGLHQVSAEDVTPVLRGRSLEIVDDQGRVRATLSVLPAGTSEQGDHLPETVLLRLITERGRASAKLSTSEDGAALSLAGPTGTRDTYIVMEADGTASSLRLRNEDGREQILRPE